MNKNSYISEKLQKKLHKHLIFVKEGCIISGNSNNISKRSMTKMKKTVKIDITIIMFVSLISAILYIALEGIIMDYGRELSNPLLLRFMPVLAIQFGMSVL